MTYAFRLCVLFLFLCTLTTLLGRDHGVDAHPNPAIVDPTPTATSTIPKKDDKEDEEEEEEDEDEEDPVLKKKREDKYRKQMTETVKTKKTLADKLFDQLLQIIVYPRDHSTECALSPADASENTWVCDIGTLSKQSSQALSKLWTRDRYGAQVMDAIHEDMTRTKTQDGRSPSIWQNTDLEDIRFNSDATCKKPWWKFWKKQQGARGMFEIVRQAGFKRKIVRVNFACE